MLVLEILKKEVKKMKIHGSSEAGAIGESKISRSGGQVDFGVNVGKIQEQLKGLGKEAMQAHSVIEVFGDESTKLSVQKDDSIDPRCQHIDLPMTNQALLGTAKAISEKYGPNSQIALITGGMPNPSTYEIMITSVPSHPACQFMKEDGLPMGIMT
jgi:hypothetical protein